MGISRYLNIPTEGLFCLFMSRPIDFHLSINSRPGSFVGRKRSQKRRLTIYVSFNVETILPKVGHNSPMLVYHKKSTRKKQNIVRITRESFIHTNLSPLSSFPCYCIGCQCFLNGHNDGLKQGFDELDSCRR